MVLVEESGMKLIDLISLLTVKPRKIMDFNLDLFKKGVPAEIVIIDHNHEWIFDKIHIQSKSENSPFIGEKLKGRVELTLSGIYAYKN